MPFMKETRIEEIITYFKTQLHCEENFDVVYRTLSIAQKTCAIFFVDGFIKDEVVEKILEFFYSVQDDSLLKDAHTFAQNCVPYCEVTLSDQEDDIITGILSGMMALFLDGCNRAILLDTRTYPQRDTSEPEKDKVFRGSKDGFVETFVFNTALIRRRIRDRNLMMEHLSIGTTSKTDVALCYMKDRADLGFVKQIKKRLQSIRPDALTMNQQSLAELLWKPQWFNPFPKFKYSERPDTTAAQILEGNVVIIVDNSPSAMILPVNLFDLMEEANDFYFPPITGTYLRITRFLVSLVTLLITPTWLLFLFHPSYVPEALKFILVDPGPVPILLQLLLLEISIDGLKLAALNTPNMLTTALSMLGAVILGDFSVKSGWFCGEALLYMAFVTIANYSLPGFELGYALKFCRIFLLLTTAWLGLWGYIGGILLLLITLACNKTTAGKGYLYPLLPFCLKDFKRKILRLHLNQPTSAHQK